MRWNYPCGQAAGIYHGLQIGPFQFCMLVDVQNPEFKSSNQEVMIPSLEEYSSFVLILHSDGIYNFESSSVHQMLIT